MSRLAFATQGVRAGHQSRALQGLRSPVVLAQLLPAFNLDAGKSPFYLRPVQARTVRLRGMHGTIAVGHVALHTHQTLEIPQAIQAATVRLGATQLHVRAGQLQVIGQATATVRLHGHGSQVTVGMAGVRGATHITLRGAIVQTQAGACEVHAIQNPTDEELLLMLHAANTQHRHKLH